MARSLLTAYQGLPTADHEAALESLLRHLSYRERLHVQDVLSELNDPFSRLPLEILICVFDYFHPFEVWCRRLICHRWRSALSSESFEEAAIARFQTHHPSDAARKHIAGESRATQFRHVQALRLGLPFHFQEVHDAFATNLRTPTMRACALKCHHLAYLRGQSSQSDTLVLRDLMKGASSILRGVAREQILGLALSRVFVGFVTFQGHLYVSPLSVTGNTIPRIRLPSSTVVSMTADEDIFVVLLKGTSTGMFIVFVCDAGTLRTKSFDFQAGQLADETGYGASDERMFNPQAMLVDYETRMIHVFSSAHEQQRDQAGFRTNEVRSVIRHTCLSLSGEERIVSNIENEKRGTSSTSSGPILKDPVALSDIRPTGQDGEHYMFMWSLNDLIPGSSTSLLMFDTKSLRVKRMVDPGPLPLWGLTSSGHTFRFTVWKDRVYTTRHDSGLSTYRRSDIERRGNPVCETAGPSSRSWQNTDILLINDSFMVKINPKREFLQISSFEEGLHAPGYLDTGFWSAVNGRTPMAGDYRCLPRYAEVAKLAGVRPSDIYDHPDLESSY